MDNSVQSEAQQLDTSSPLLTSSQSMLKNSSDDHSLNVEFEYTPDTKNYILFTPVFNYSKYDNLSGINIKQTGLINQMVKSNPDNRYSKPLGTANLYWQHLFNKPGRNFSIEAGYLQSTESFQSLQSDRISYLTPKRRVSESIKFEAVFTASLVSKRLSNCLKVVCNCICTLAVLLSGSIY